GWATHATESTSSAKRIVLICGQKSEGPARHDYPNGIRVLKTLLETSPDFRGIAGVQVDAYPDGWPDDPRSLEGARAVVWYFDGAERHPLLDAKRRAMFERAMRRGAGIVALHQSSTVPAKDTALRLERWLGAARFGFFDRATQDADVRVAASAH